jgi:ribosomal protein S18 acetylase RimI-like enzyme
VGWLWLTPLEDGIAFLEQITVAEAMRRRGHGRAMLAALEELLAREGIQELRLTVNRGNEPARALYAAAGYESTGGDDRELFLHKRFTLRAQS